MTKGTAIGLYFGGMSKEQINALRARLNALFGAMGYGGNEDSTPPYRGALPAGLLALDEGELVLILLPPEQRRWVREWLYREAQVLEDVKANSFEELGIIEALRVIADAL